MTIESALWMQNVDYPARLDRALIAAMYDEGALDLTQFVVSERGAGANYTVDVTAGKAIIAGDDEPNQGNYYVASTSTENLTVTSAPGADSRIDIVVLRVNDQNAGGPVTDDVTLEIIAGTPAASPVAPAAPDSSIVLARIGPIFPSTPAITDAFITDARPIAGRKATPGTLEWRADGVVPNGWLRSGLTYDPAEHPALFAHIGVTYGGNGTTTFGTPSAEGRVLVAPGGTLAGSVGDTGGATTHTLTAAQIPSHVHSIATHTHTLPAHNHSTPSHTHSINHGHTATSNNTGSHQHTFTGSGSTVSAGSHNHTTPINASSGSFTNLTGGHGGSGASSAIGTSFGGDHGHTVYVSGTTASAGNHTHTITVASHSGASGSGGSGTTGDWSGSSGSGGPTSTGSIGSGNSHPIVQPYTVVGGLVIRT